MTTTADKLLRAGAPNQPELRRAMSRAGRLAPWPYRAVLALVAALLVLAAAPPPVSALAQASVRSTERASRLGSRLAFEYASRLSGIAALQDVSDGPVVDGIALERTIVAGIDLFYDADVDAEILATAGAALTLSLDDVPALTGLPAFVTPIRAFILADEDRFRLALAEIASVRTDLVADDIAGYTIERDGTMLIFFAAPNLAEPASAILGYAHELAHLAVREATQRRALPQWFNEGYASWIAVLAVERHYPEVAALQRQLDRLEVASGLHTRGLIPWPDLVTRTRFSRAGVDGLVGLAYGQSTLFIDLLAQRHGVPALARFLTGIGEGQGATQAFSGAFGVPFGPEAAAFEASLVPLKAELRPGLHILQRATAEQPAVFGLVGGPALETAIVELFEDGVLIRRREIDLDGAGAMVASLPPALLEGSGLRLRVTVPVLGALELDPVAGTSAHPQSAPTPSSTGAPAPAVRPATSTQPAPVQVPTR